MESRDTYAYFWLTRFDCPVDEITRAMGLEPSRAWNQGQPGSYREEMSYSGWDLNSPLGRGDIGVERHVEALVAVLEERSGAVRDLADRYEAGISCIGFFTAEDAGFRLSRRVVERIAALGLCLDFDLSCLHEEDETP